MPIALHWKRATAYITLSLLLAGCYRATAKDGAEPVPQQAGSVDRVVVGKPKRKTLKLFTTQPGRITAFEEAPLHSKLEAYVGEVLVDIGDVVEKGQVLLKLSVPELEDVVRQHEAKVALADAELLQAEAALVAAEAVAESARSRISQAEAAIGRTKGGFEKWKAEAERMRELAQRGSITQKLVDETQNQLSSAAAAQQESLAGVQSARAGLNEAQANVEISKADIVAAQARKRSVQSDLAHAQTMLAYAEVKAPFAGVVTRRNVDTGHFVGTGTASPALLVVSRMDKVRVSVDVPEMEAPLVTTGAKGDPVSVKVQTLVDKTTVGTVTRTGWSLDSTNRSLRTEIDIDNKEQQLRPGMYASVEILLEQRDDVLTLPSAAIVREGQGTFCCTVVDGKVKRAPITLGLRVGDDVEIASGINDSTAVVLARAASLQDGQPVEIIPEKQP